MNRSRFLFSLATWIGRHRTSIAFVLVALFCTTDAYAQVDENQFTRDVKAIAAFPTRMPGTPGYRDAAAYLQQQITALNNVQLRRHVYPIMVPFTESATIVIPGQPAENIYPLWPAGIRLNATPAEGITGRLVYCRNAELKDIVPAELNGQIAVLETTSGQNWTNAVNMGAQAILLLGTAQTSNIDLRAHEVPIPVNFPRFYVPPGPLADAIRAKRVTTSITLRASVSWRKVLAVNYYALVKPVAPPATGTEPPAALGITVPFDSSSLVPDLAPGASQAVQTACALGLLRDLSARPPPRPVLFCFTGADSIAFLGSRNLYMALSDVPATWTSEINDLTSRQTDAEHQLQRVRQVLNAPKSLDIYNDRALINRLSKIVETRAMFVQERLFEVRDVNQSTQTPAIVTERRDLEARQAMLSRLEFAFKQNPAALTTPELATETSAVCRQCIDDLGGSIETHRDGLVQDLVQRRELLEDRVDLYHWLANAEGRNPDPQVGADNEWLIELMVGLDLTDRAYHAGPMNFGRFAHSSTVADIQHYSEWFTSAQQKYDDGQANYGWFREVDGKVDLTPLSNALAPTSWMPGSQSIPSEMGQAWGMPAHVIHLPG